MVSTYPCPKSLGTKIYQIEKEVTNRLSSCDAAASSIGGADHFRMRLLSCMEDPRKQAAFKRSIKTGCLTFRIEVFDQLFRSSGRGLHFDQRKPSTKGSMGAWRQSIN